MHPNGAVLAHAPSSPFTAGLSRTLLGTTLLMALGCGPTIEPDTSNTTSGSTSNTSTSTSDTSTSTGDTSTSTTPTSTSSTTGPTSSGSTEPACNFLGCTTTEPGLPGPSCDVFNQDCPDGDKCAAIISDGGSSWDSTACVPVNGSGQAGDACIAESVAAGLDDCAKGVMCWDVDDMGMGTCVALCTGTADAPICPDQGSCTIANDGALNLCLPACSPLLQDCSEGNACYPVGDAFTCAPDASGDTGVANDPCEFINVCEAGLMCADAAFVGIGCPQGSTGCCTPFCDLSDPVPCPNPDQSCVPFFTDPMSIPIDPPDAKDIGVCGLPM
jgi:hypothetical protein